MRSEILLTHGHDDHTGSARELARITGAKVRGPALDAGVIEGRARRQDPQLEEWEVPLFEQFGTVAPAPPVKLDDRLEKGSLLAAVGGQRQKTRGAAVYLPRNDVDLSSRLIHQIRPDSWQLVPDGMVNDDGATGAEHFGAVAGVGGDDRRASWTEMTLFIAEDQ